MIEYRVKIDDTFLGIWLGGNKGNIILGCGLPQYIDKYHPLVEQVSRLGYNLFVPRYHGTFESGGNFDTASSVQSIKDAINVVKSGKATELFNNGKIAWSNDIPLYLFGYSYGALPALLSNEKVGRTILVCPFISVNYHLENTSGEILKETFEFVKRAYPNLYRLEPSLVIEDLLNIKLPENKDRLVVVSSLNDTSIPKEEIDFLSEKYPKARFVVKDGGHSIKISDELFLDLLNYTE